MFVKELHCPKCRAVHAADQIIQTCTCGAPLLAVYDSEKIAARIRKEDLTSRPHTLWRYRELLPVRDAANIISLSEGMTPLIPLEKLGRELGLADLRLKDESPQTTGTFKARGASVGVSRARELGVHTLAMPTNGNAGGAWAAYCARAGIRAVLVMSKNAPAMNRMEIGMLGASLFLVDGVITDAGAVVNRAIAEHGWLNAATFKEPWRIEGKKTLGFELAEQFGWDVPDAVLVPCGGGLGIIGIYKGLRELQKIGWIGSRLPRLIAVQSTGCAPMVRAFQEARPDVEFWENAKTCAFGITAPRPVGAFLTLEAIRKTDGYAVAVDDTAILRAQKELAAREGCYICPEGAATVAALPQLRRDGVIGPRDRVVLLNTGTGLKYPETADYTAREVALDASIA
ncbi:threonine synthase [Desulfovibrio sp. 6_1_46AFAA]|uniref:threonine synthase n=1 Tax=Desulfovibrio sp. 6_1_46AFAA TaxID=665942 RepID=UPI0002236E9A|nr:threonine synthase [Desulfovibrio sp. 6_1_46AFAA]EGW50619.1 threonine synthase [Desulfovibrio sp. 6_1_46AFAA]